MPSNRIGRINEEIQRELSALIRTVKDPRVHGLVSITAVDTAPDLRYAKVYVSVLDKSDVKEVIKGLKSAAGYLRRELGRACELSCDEGVLRRLDEAGRRAYGAALLALARPAPGETKHNMTLAMSRDGEQLKERLYAIMKFQSRGKLTVTAAVGVAAALCLCGVLAGACAADLTGQAEESGEPGLLVISEPLVTEEQAEPAGVDEEELLSPLDGDTLTVTMPFGTRVHPITGRTTSHDGLDIQAESGAAVYAPRSGQVLEAALNQEYGNYVVIGWDGGEVLFAHLSACAVAEGDQVTQGQNVGYVGQTGMATGPHLHVEVRQGGEPADPETCFAGVTFVH